MRGRNKVRQQGELIFHGSEAATPTLAEPDARAAGQPCTSLSDNSGPATRPATMHSLLPPDLIRQLVTFAATSASPSLNYGSTRLRRSRQVSGTWSPISDSGTCGRR
jgi:hypothetical protein